MRSFAPNTEHQPSLSSDRFASISRGVVFCPAAMVGPQPGRMAGVSAAGVWPADFETIYRIAYARAAAQIAARAGDLYNAPLCLN